MNCKCRRCEVVADLQAAREDETLSAVERQELIQDLKGDLQRYSRCMYTTVKRPAA